MRAFDTIVIGAGQAGVPLSRVLAGRGQRVALVERSRPGGSCVNFGCTPTKALIASARIAHQVRTAAAWGVRAPEPGVDFPAVMRRVHGLVADAVSSLERDLDGANDPVLVRGEARLDGREGQGGPIRVSVHGDAGIESFSAWNVVLDTGTRTAIPDLPGLDADRPDPRLVTAETWVDLDTLPARLLVLGGSTLGLEFAQAFSRLGAAVTVLQDGDRLAPQEDPDISETIRDILRAEGLQVRLGVAVERVEWRPDGVRLHLRDGGTVDGSHLLVATGRAPNTGSLGLDTLELEPDEHGRVPVDDRLRTPVPGLWAAGDITPGPQFTHLAYADHAVIAAAMAGKAEPTATGRVIPYAVFLDPPLGRVGVTEAQAREEGRRLRIGTKPMSTSGKARELGETAGLIKVVIDADTDRILGAACLCHAGAEVVQIVTALMTAGITAGEALDAIAIHPTIGEALKNAIRDAE